MKTSMCGVLAVGVAAAASVFLFQNLYARRNKAEHEQSLVRQDVAKIIFACYERNKRPPTGLEDLKPFADEFPQGYHELMAGKWTVRWGTPLGESHRASGNQDRVLAYQMSRAEGRSIVLFGDRLISLIDDNKLKDVMETSDALHATFDMYSAYLTQHRAPPASEAALRAFAVARENVLLPTDSRRLTVRWGTAWGHNAAENASVVIAYAPVWKGTNFVLAADGIVYIESTGEFAE
jgi:hypothetical protein